MLKVAVGDVSRGQNWVKYGKKLSLWSTLGLMLWGCILS